MRESDDCQSACFSPNVSRIIAAAEQDQQRLRFGSTCSEPAVVVKAARGSEKEAVLCTTGPGQSEIAGDSSGEPVLAASCCEPPVVGVSVSVSSGLGQSVSVSSQPVPGPSGSSVSDQVFVAIY